MPSLIEIRNGAMAKNAKNPDAPIGGGLLDRIDNAIVVVNAAKDQPAGNPQNRAGGGGGGGGNKDKGKEPHNSICVTAKIIEFSTKKTKPKEGSVFPAKDMTTYTVIIENTGEGPIQIRHGRRTPEGDLELRIWGEQPFNQAQKDAHKALMDKSGKIGENDPRRKLGKKKGFISETYLLTPGPMHFIVFSAPFTDKNNMVLPAGADVIISGIEPTMNLKMTEDGTQGAPEFGVNWNIGKMFVNPKGGFTSLKETWNKQRRNNKLPNLYKGPGGGCSPENVTPEEQKLLEDFERDGTLEKNAFQANKFLLSPEQRAKLVGSLYIPLGQDAGFGPDKYSPYEIGQRYAVKFMDATFSEVYADLPKDLPPVMEMTIWMKVQVLQLHREPELAFVKVYISSKQLGETGFFRFGIVAPHRWAKVAPAYIPWISGYVVARLNLNESLKSEYNEPQLNGRDEAGVPQFQGPIPGNFHYGVHFNSQLVDPDLTSIALSPNAFQINLKCTQFLLEQVLGGPDPSTIGSESAKLNPLNTGTKPVINMFECNENPVILQQNGYYFYLIYQLSKLSERVSADRIRKYMEKKKMDPVAQFSKMFMTPPTVGGEEHYKGEEDIFNHMPLPDLEKTDSYCVFAIRKTEVDRVKKGPVELPLDQFLDEVARIEKQEEAKFGPAPPAPPKQLRLTAPPPPPQQLQLAAPPAPTTPEQHEQMDETVTEPVKSKRPSARGEEAAPPKRERHPPATNKKTTKTIRPPVVIEEPSADLEDEDVDPQ